MSTRDKDSFLCAAIDKHHYLESKGYVYEGYNTYWKPQYAEEIEDYSEFYQDNDESTLWQVEIDSEIPF